MMFPYAITRAYRDGGVKTQRFEMAMGILLRDLLAEQRNYGSSYKGKWVLSTVVLIRQMTFQQDWVW